MWHEARRQEKKIRGIMVDYKRRADRRREFYEKIKQDPAQFLRMYGRPAKIHLDPAVAMAAEGPQSMMPWQGDNANMIDRFDVRANLDYIPEYVPDRHKISHSLDEDERLANYERYRTLVENEAAGLSEEQCLHQIYMDEHFGTINKGNEDEKKKNADKKAAIGFVYEDSTPISKDQDIEDSDEEESEEDLETADLDVTIDVDMLTPDMIKEVNMCAAQYGMRDDDFIRLLRKDKEELETLKAAKQLEEAKAQFSGRKSRRERRAINEKRQNPQRFSRPSYAARESPKYEPYKRPGSSSRSRSRSRSSEVAPVRFITSFGAESEEEGGVVQGPSFPSNVKSGVKKRTSQPEPSKCETPWLARHGSSRHRRSRSRSRRSSSRSRSRSHSPARGKHHSSSKSSFSSGRSFSRSKSRSRSWSRSDNRRSSSFRQGSNGRSGLTRSRREQRSQSTSSSKSHSRSRSMSRSSRTKSLKRSESPTKKPVIKRYRRDSLSSGSELSGLESDDEKKKNSSTSLPVPKALSKNESNKISELSKSGKISSKPSLFQTSSTGPKKTPQERLKRRMQAQLARQFKADKKAEITKISKQEQERLDREEEIRTLALEMRRREREKRHREREEEEKERQEQRKSRHSDKGSQSGDSQASSSSNSDSESDSPSCSPQNSPVKMKDVKDRGKLEKKLEDKQVEGRKDERKRGSQQPTTALQVSDERRKSDDRKWEGRRERSRWDGDGERDKIRDQRSGRWDGPSGPHSTNLRFEEGSYSRNWGPDSSRWEGGRGDWRGGSRQSRFPPGISRSRVPRPLLSRSRSPLMSRPRPPSDPSLLEESLNFD